MTLEYERKLAVMERKEGYAEPKQYEETQIYEIRSNIKAQELYGKPSVITEIRPNSLSWLGLSIIAKLITNDVRVLT